MRKVSALLTILALYVTTTAAPVLAAHQFVQRARGLGHSNGLAVGQQDGPKAPKPKPTPTPAPTPTPTPAPGCSPGIFTFSGNSQTDGPDGNVRTYSFGGVNVHASAFSKPRSGGAFQTAYLYQNNKWGLGVTNQ